MYGEVYVCVWMCVRVFMECYPWYYRYHCNHIKNEHGIAVYRTCTHTSTYFPVLPLPPFRFLRYQYNHHRILGTYFVNFFSAYFFKEEDAIHLIVFKRYSADASKATTLAPWYPN